MTVSTLVVRSASETMAEFAFVWSLESGGRFCVDRNRAVVDVKSFKLLIFFVKKCYKCTYNAI